MYKVMQRVGELRYSEGVRDFRKNATTSLIQRGD